MNLTIALCTAVMPALVAQQGNAGGNTNIAVVNLAEIFTRFQMTADLEQKFDERRQSVSREAKSKRDAINLQRGALLDLKPDSADFKNRRDDLIRSEVEFKAWLEIQELHLKEQHKDWLKLIYMKTQDVIAKIASQRKIDLVLSYNDMDEDAPDSVSLKQQILLRNVIYANNRVNLTDPVIAMLDADYQRGGGAAAFSGQ